MSVARISIVEYQSVDDAKVGIEKYKNIAPAIFAEAQYLNVTMIAEDTAHFLAVYPNQQAADEALQRRNKHVDSMKEHIRDVMYYEGDVEWQWFPWIYGKFILQDLGGCFLKNTSSFGKQET